MNLSYKNTELQLLNFYRKFLKNQTSEKTYRKIKSIIMIPIGIVLSLSIYLSRKPLIEVHGQIQIEDILYIVLPLVFGVSWYLIYIFLYQISIKENLLFELKTINYSYEEDLNININEEGIIVKREDSSLYIKWNAIKEVSLEKDMIYLILRDGTALIIPMESFNEDNTKEDFLKLIVEYTSIEI